MSKTEELLQVKNILDKFVGQYTTRIDGKYVNVDKKFKDKTAFIKFLKEKKGYGRTKFEGVDIDIILINITDKPVPTQILEQKTLSGRTDTIIVKKKSMKVNYGR